MSILISTPNHIPLTWVFFNSLCVGIMHVYLWRQEMTRMLPIWHDLNEFPSLQVGWFCKSYAIVVKRIRGTSKNHFLYSTMNIFYGYIQSCPHLRQIHGFPHGWVKLFSIPRDPLYDWIHYTLNARKVTHPCTILVLSCLTLQG